MPDLHSTAPAATNDLERAAEELSALARELSPSIERDRRLPRELLDRLRRCGLFRAGAPATVSAPDVAAGVWAPRGTARRVDGGYRVSGRWAFCSGITHSDYLFGGCIVEELLLPGDRRRVLTGRLSVGQPTDPTML